MRIYDNGVYRDATPEEAEEIRAIAARTADAEPDALELLRQQVEAVAQQNAMLVECLLEISEIIYE